MDARVQEGVVSANFAGTPRKFFALVLKGSLLQIPTFGFYRFWLLTDIRRHLWTNTRLGTESFEYTGRARELLIGFLIALAILVPIYLLSFLLSLEVERLQAFASIPFFLILYVLSHYATYRARRYRATRTVFRGLRFSMTGSGWAYMGRAVLWDLLTVVTVGLALPWRAAALERYRMRHTHYGSLPGAFVGTGGALFERGWWLWATALLSVAFTYFLVNGLSGSGVGQPKSVQVMLIVGVSAIPLLLLLMFWLFIWPMFRAIQLRWRLEGICFGDVTLKSALSNGSIIRCYLKAWLAGFVFLLAIVIVVGIVVAMLRIDFTELAAPGRVPSPIPIAIVPVYLVVFIGLSVIKLHFLDRGVWAAAVNSLAVMNMAALDAAVAQGEAAGSVGEGLVDALDFGGAGV